MTLLSSVSIRKPSGRSELCVDAKEVPQKERVSITRVKDGGSAGLFMKNAGGTIRRQQSKGLSPKRRRHERAQ